MEFKGSGLGLLGLIVAFSLTACGESDSIGVRTSEETSDNRTDATSDSIGVKTPEEISDNTTYATFDDLPGCGKKLADEIYFVKEDDVSYICNDDEKDWIEVVSSFKKLPTCNAKREKRIYYVDADEEYVVCRESGEWESLDAVADMSKTKDALSSSVGSENVMVSSSSVAEENNNGAEIVETQSSSAASIPASSSAIDPIPSSSSIEQSSSSVKSSSSFVCGDLWCGVTDTTGRVNTGYAGKASGYWYFYTDRSNAGTSRFTFPNEMEDSGNESMRNLIKDYGGIKGRITFGGGTTYPYSAIAFNIKDDGKAGDISDWNGICLVYQSTIDFEIELVVENPSVVTEDDNYRAKVTKSRTTTTLNIPWFKFSQGGWGKVLDLQESLEITSTVSLLFTGSAGTSGDFFIQSIGRSGTCK